MRELYVGITGFMSSGEVCQALSVCPTLFNRKIMIGVLASYKTMQGIQNKWPNRYPAIDQIANIFLEDSRTLNLIHYHTQEMGTLLDQLIEMTKIGGKNLHGLQLNIAWPSPNILINYRKIYPEKKIVLQINRLALEQIDHSSENLVRKLAEYEGIIDYILLDTSGGYGRQFDLEKYLYYLLELKDKDLDIGIGIAGGLNATTLEIVRALISIGKISHLSIDAEGKLRTIDDHLDLEAVEKYLRKASDIFNK